MGRSYSAVLSLILMLAAASLLGQANQIAAELTDFALPEYRNDGRQLQYIIYGRKAVNLGDYVKLTHPCLDAVYPEMDDISKLTPIFQIVPYPLNSSSKTIAEFWKKYPMSQVLIFGRSGVYQKTEKILRGDAEFEFRSRELDLNGVGFDVFFKRKFLHIRNKVRVVIHPETLSGFDQ